MTNTVMVIEDEEAIATLLSYNLEKEGYKVIVVNNGANAVNEVDKHHPSVIILDWMLPEISGVEICKLIRSKPDIKAIPIIMLTAKSQEEDKIKGLGAGADDYVTKPFETRELIARIRAVLRRYGDEESPRKLEFDNLIIDKESYTITVKGEKMEIPPKEIELLYFLASSPNRVFTRAQLLDDVWGFDYMGETNIVDVYIRYIRSKIDDIYNVKIIHTVRGVGYVIRE